MASTQARAWLPSVVGVAAFLLGSISLRELMYIPTAQGEFLLFGVTLTGHSAWTAAVVHVLYLFNLAYAAMSRRSVAVWLVLGYCGFWIAEVWLDAGAYLPNASSRAVTSAMVTMVLVVVCRVVYVHREEFPG